MVQSKTAKTQTPKRRRAASTRSARPKSKPDLVIDPELLSDDFNQTHRPRLPNGVVINDKPAGLFLPLAQLEQAEWKTLPDDDELTSTEITGEEIGLFLTEARLLVLTFVPTYIRYKSDSSATGQVIGRYEDHRAKLDKKLMDVVSEHAIVFLDDDNQPLHDIPFTIRFKNVALWSFIELRGEGLSPTGKSRLSVDPSPLPGQKPAMALPRRAACGLQSPEGRRSAQ